jgi:pimeloyl-ACP methyl ester carboxylesterase
MPWFLHGTSRIYFEEAGSGEPVLLLPGFSDSVLGHVMLRDQLARRYRVIAADLPGSGRSGPQPRDYHPDYYQDDAQALMAFLTDLLAEPAHLIGFSDGGEVALLMAALSPAVARSVLTWGAQGTIIDPNGQIAAWFRAVVDNHDPESQGYRDYLVSTYGEFNARAMTQSFANAITAIAVAGGDISRSKAGRITCPVLLIVGQNDPFVTKTRIDEIAGEIMEANTIEVEEAGHGVHEDQPEWFARTVTEWLVKH